MKSRPTSPCEPGAEAVFGSAALESECEGCATGLRVGDAAEVRRQILEKAPLAPAQSGATDEHGTRWKVDVDLVGRDGTMKVRTGWITEPSGHTRLVTISFPPKGER